MKSDVQSVTLICASSLHWVQDKDRVLIVAEPARAATTLYGAEAALWGWLMLGYPYLQVVELFSALLGLPPDRGEQTLASILENWCEQGLLLRKESACG